MSRSTGHGFIDLCRSCGTVQRSCACGQPHYLHPRERDLWPRLWRRARPDPPSSRCLRRGPAALDWAQPTPRRRATGLDAQASAAAQEALVTGRTVADIVLAPGLLTQANLDDILRPEASYGPAVAVPGDSGKEAGSDGATRPPRRQRPHQRMAVLAHGRKRRSPS
ncbi:hypothetical protein ACFQ6O_22215 [Streptomyces sp. NPDC056441]|uniref:hypothetical protein n=1 Tax=Streptomyces sp. NPDC056441 TaxID=3345817 RepID=UPI003678C45D